MNISDLVSWPDGVDSLRFRPADTQPPNARRMSVLVNGADVGTLDASPAGWHLSLNPPGGDIVEHTFIAATDDAAFDENALCFWAIVHTLAALV